jgi:hypothetical protein
MPDFTADIDISPSDYIYECSDYEIKELITELKEGGYLKGGVIDTDDNNIIDDEWTEMINKIYKNRLLLSNEDEEIIRNISKRLI